MLYIEPTSYVCFPSWGDPPLCMLIHGSAASGCMILLHSACLQSGPCNCCFFSTALWSSHPIRLIFIGHNRTNGQTCLDVWKAGRKVMRACCAVPSVPLSTCRTVIYGTCATVCFSNMYWHSLGNAHLSADVEDSLGMHGLSDPVSVAYHLQCLICCVRLSGALLLLSHTHSAFD